MRYSKRYSRDDGYDADRDARAMGYANAYEAQKDNWGMPVQAPQVPVKPLDTKTEKP